MKFLSGVLAATLAMSACAQAEPTSPSSATSSIISLSPTSGAPGTVVTVTGAGFASEGNILKFGAGYIKNVRSPDGRTLRFTVPATLDQCPPSTLGLGVPCPAENPEVSPGNYAVSLVGAASGSKELTFVVPEQ